MEIFNDGTIRDYQKRTHQWTIGKNFDQTGGFGPEMVTTDELPRGAKGLRIASLLNGKIMQQATTKDMIFDVAKTIQLMTECFTLEPGDVIVSGTPEGVGYVRKPPVYMKEGDEIVVEIEGIGRLINHVTHMQTTEIQERHYHTQYRGQSWPENIVSAKIRAFVLCKVRALNFAILLRLLPLPKFVRSCSV